MDECRIDDDDLDTVIEGAKDHCKDIDNTFEYIACVREYVTDFVGNNPDLLAEGGDCQDHAWLTKQVLEGTGKTLPGDPSYCYVFMTNHVLLKVEVSSWAGNKYVYYIDHNLDHNIFIPGNQCAEACAGDNELPKTK